MEGDSSLIPMEVFWEILMWLPVKSLMRFKCVCKLWLSVILNPSFARAYRGGFKGLLLTNIRYLSQYSDVDVDFFYLNLLEGEGMLTNMFHQYTLHRGGKKRFTGVVNGLVCYYCGKYSWIYNIATRESMQLPDSTHDSIAWFYHLGFDPSKQTYKLIKTCYDRRELEKFQKDGRDVFPSRIKSEIFTIGVDSSWRSIDHAPWVVYNTGLCIDGVLYWTDPEICSRGQLLCFDLAREEFRFVFHPQESLVHRLRLLWFGPNVALSASKILPDSNQATVLYLHNDGTASQDGGMQDSWKEHIVYLPQVLKPGEPEQYALYTPMGILPGGEVIFMNRIKINWEFPAVLYLYDPTKREVKKRYMWSCPSSIAQQHKVDISDYVYLWHYEENIMPLNCLGSQSRSTSE
ncbi:OLC1v1004753C1 [Oldenlandia corymbosa var. corymbosa]|uniref:OLC1v1004753C1 n=1 Tax=Oldenlandia corymbosa var. corymbosa TaxID=529605 RepID=A0AAV1DG00_OLDCO|nr:OLC1v1004753C1 [Oldenlandia corymbosa var. corymbosa]